MAHLSPLPPPAALRLASLPSPPLLVAAVLSVVATAAGLAGFTSAGIPFAAVAVGISLSGVLIVAAAHRRDVPFGLPNAVTLVRLVLVSLLAGHLADQLVAGPSEALAWAFAGTAAVALALDGVDGWLARTRGPATAFGARFDMETDAFAILVLAGLAFVTGKAGAWVMLIGLMRYVFVAASFAWPWLAGPLPPSFRRKLVCVVQGVVLVVLALPPVGAGLGAPLAALALAALAWSFAVDVRHLAGAGRSP